MSLVGTDTNVYCSWHGVGSHLSTSSNRVRIDIWDSCEVSRGVVGVSRFFCCPSAAIATQFQIVPMGGSHVGGWCWIHTVFFANFQNYMLDIILGTKARRFAILQDKISPFRD